MIARSRPAAPTSTLPASLILTPREQKQYRRYQSQTSTLAPKNQGRLPTAIEYADFQSWLAKRDSGYLSDTPLADIAYYAERAANNGEENGKASTCGHALHPTHKEKAERCPVCIVEAHITYMKVVTNALEAAGGLAKQRWEAADQECPALQAWYAGKLALIHELDRLENLIQLERGYDNKSHSSTSVGDLKTATQALDMYWESMEANPNMLPSSRQKKACTVVFCPDTSFERGRDQLYFWHKSPRYEAGGKYSSSNDDDEVSEEDEPEELSNPAANATRKATSPGHVVDRDEDESDEEQSDLDDEDDSDEGDEDEDEDEDDEDDVEGEGDFVVFEYEEVVIPGADFVVFED